MSPVPIDEADIARLQAAVYERATPPATEPSQDAVARLAEEYRVRLGLKTYEAQVAWARAALKRMAPATDSYSGRRSGRTTFALLWSIADASLRGCAELHVDGNDGGPNTAYVRGIASDLIERLGLGIRVIVDRRPPGPGKKPPECLYVDHWMPDHRGM